MTTEKFQNPRHILSILEEMFNAINLVSDAPRLFQQVLDFCIRFTGATTGSLIMVEPDTGVLNIKVARGLGANIEEKVRLKVGEGLTGWAAQHKEPLLCNNVKEDERYVPIKDYIQSEMVVPLLFEEKVIGIISVDSSKLEAFSESDLYFLTFIAPLLTQIVRNIELFDRLRVQYERDKILLEINEAVIEAVNLRNGLYRVLEILADHLQFIRGSIVLKDPHKELMHIVVGYGLSVEEQKRGSYKKGEGVVGKIFQTGEPVVIRELEKDESFLDRTQSRPSLENISFIAFPVKFKKEVLGVLWFDKNYTISPSTVQHDLELLEFVTSFLTQQLKHYSGGEEERGREEQSFTTEAFAFRIQTSSPPVQQILSSLQKMSSAGLQVLISHPSRYERRALAYEAYLHKGLAHRPFLYIDAGDESGEQLFSNAGHLEKTFQNNFCFIDNLHHLLPDYQALLAKAQSSRSQFIAGTPLAPSELREDRILPRLWDTFHAVFTFPPFRERKADLQHYLEEFIHRSNHAWKTHITGMKDEAREAIIERSLQEKDAVSALLFLTTKTALLRQSGVIELMDVLYAADQMPAEEYHQSSRVENILAGYFTSMLSSRSGNMYDRAMEMFETKLLDSVYQQTGGNKQKTAEILGVNRTTLYKKLKKYGYL